MALALAKGTKGDYSEEMDILRCADCGGINRLGKTPSKSQPVCGRCKKRLDLSGTPQAVNAAQMKAAVKSSPVPVIVDFWAPWCGPCRTLAPVLEGVAQDFAGKVLVLKLNSDENPGPSRKYAIRGIPALLLFKAGAEAARQTGALPKAQLKAWVQGNLNAG